MQAVLEVPALSADVDHGVVFTRPWVVNLILDSVGYTSNVDLTQLTAIEPAFGQGAFLLEMARRLVIALERFEHSWDALSGAIVAVELDVQSARHTSERLIKLLSEAGASTEQAMLIVKNWIHVSDFLLDDSLSTVEADFVIGNPPYVRPEAIEPGKLAEYRQRYKTMIGRADIYVAFFERGLALLREGGQLSFICADRWMLNAYGRDLRRLVTSHHAVDLLINMHHAHAFDDEVLAYPAIISIRRGEQTGTAVASVTGELTAGQAGDLAQRMSQAVVGVIDDDFAKLDHWFEGDEPWPSGTPEQVAMLRVLEDSFPLIQDAGVRVGIGIATGADRVFITSDPDTVEPERMLPLVMGRDTITGELQWSGKYLVNPWSAEGLVDLDDFPKLRQYFENNSEALLGRNVAKRSPATWYRTIDRVIAGLTERPKLLIPDIKGTLHPVLDQGELYPHHNLYFMVSDEWPIEALGGLLLSDVAEFFVASYCVRMAGGFLRFQAQYLRRIRIPKASEVDAATMEELAHAFANRDRAQASAIAHRLYGITGIPG